VFKTLLQFPRTATATSAAAVVAAILVRTIRFALAGTNTLSAKRRPFRAATAVASATVITAFFVLAERKADTHSIGALFLLAGTVSATSTAAVIAALLAYAILVTIHCAFVFHAVRGHFGADPALAVTTIAAALLAVAVGETLHRTLEVLTDGSSLGTDSAMTSAAVIATLFAFALRQARQLAG